MKLSMQGGSSAAQIKVLINEKPAGYVCTCELAAARTGEFLYSVGEGVCSAVVPGATGYTVALSRFLQETNPDVFTLRDFTLSLVTPEGCLRFTGCEWLEIRRKIEMGEEMLQYLKIGACALEQEVRGG